MRALFLSLTLVGLTACAPPDLSGAWVGNAYCDGFPIDMEFTLTATEDEGEYAGEGSVSASDSQGNSFFLSYALEVEHGDATDAGMDLVIDVEDCFDEDGNQYACFEAALNWDEGDDEIKGQVTEFFVQPGTCDVEVER
ncbi:MAG: hypothetical protein H6741_18375 [Alphaproteobacteria bacterium]|nr:hypothetical protein [Alphaproteobacteria bacterium]MCB9794683.1 hypothetical protein [Alphaproteobacteria bacterium]